MTVFTEITILVAVAVLVSALMRLLRQPLLIGYIITGLLVGPLFFNVIRSPETLGVFSEIGIALLLFIVGLNLTPQSIKEFGKAAFITGLGQIVFTFTIGMAICLALGFSPAVSAYLAIALALSSTILILKLLSDRGDMDKLYGRLSIGFLLVQDLAAVIILFFLPLFSRPQTSDLYAFFAVVKAVVAVAGVFLIAYKVLPRLNRFLAKSSELLFLFSLAWGLGLSAIFRAAGFSLETGALIAGITLSILPSHDEIHARLRPLRDFFIVIFFIMLGAGIGGDGIRELLLPAVLLSVFVLVGNPLIMLIFMGYLGFRKKTAFQTGLTTAQISEFSLVLVALGLRLGHLRPAIVALTTIVGIITIFGSTYLIMHSDALYSRLARFLAVFERREIREQPTPRGKPSELVLFGANRIGYDFLNAFAKLKKPFLVVDYDPETVEFLASQGIRTEYGDAGDIEFLRLLPLRGILLAVSTIPDLGTNLLILKAVKKQSPRAMVITVAHSIADALALYARGAHYVVMPHFLGGKYASVLVEDMGFRPRQFQHMRQKHIAYLHDRLQKGHEHPLPEKWR